MLGITMEESGVSKLIATKLDSDAELLRKDGLPEDTAPFIEEDIAPEEGVYIPSRPPKRIRKGEEDK